MSFKYQAGSWKKERRIIAKIEASEHGLSRRFLVTNNTCNSAKEAYENQYCPRGDMENKIKQLKLDLKADRLSCHSFFWTFDKILSLAKCGISKKFTI